MSTWAPNDPQAFEDAKCVDCGSTDICDEDETRCQSCYINFLASWGEAISDDKKDDALFNYAADLVRGKFGS